jgi:TRAP-type transport system small permease protein
MSVLLFKIDEKFKKVEYIMLIIAGFLVFISMFLIAFNIIARNLFNQPFAGTYEIVVNLFAALVSIGFSYVQGQKENIKVEIITDQLPEGFVKFIDIFGYLMGLFVIGVIAWQSGLHAWASFVHQDYSANSLLQLPTWPTKAFITLGTLMLSLRLLIDILIILFKVNLPVPKEVINIEKTDQNMI